MKKMSCLLVSTVVWIAAVTCFPSRQIADEIGRSPKPFQAPDQRARLAAIGSKRTLSPELRRAFQPAADFQPIPAPGPSDWLAQHPEQGQTFAQFVRSNPNRPDQTRNKLYILPLGEFPESSSPDLELLKSFTETFFAMEVRFRPAVKLDGLPIKIRERDDQQRQLLSTDVLKWLEAEVPDDAYCLLAFTMEDLYPDESWNFVFGQASLRNRVGAYSFARYSPAFYHQPIDDASASTVLMRSSKVLAHETGHMFGMPHCIYFHCLMNGSNHLDETDRAPVHLCPVCLRKLQSSLGFDVKQRYERLREFSERAGWTEDSAWLTRRIEFLGR